MKKLELNQMESVEGGKFWGWTEWKPNGACLNGWQSWTRSYKALWIITVDVEPNVRPC